MSKIFYPTAEKLSFLLESIHHREVALPDFQRDFVWDPRETEELIESICQNYPAGSLLRIKNSSGFYFAPREFSGAPPLSGHTPSYLILDGQQRLTSLYQALYGTGNHRYLIDLSRLMEDGDLEDCVFYLRKSEAQKRFGSMAQQAESLVFPFQYLFGEKGVFEEWLDRVLELRKESEAEKKALKQRLRELQRLWLKTVEDYEFPMVTLGEQTSASAVCTIFETLNRTGVKLSVFDLLAARFWAREVRLRDLWEQAKTEHPIIADFDVDPYYILQAVAIFTARGAASCKRKDVLALELEQVQRGWQLVVRGLAEFLHLLRNDCGVLLPQWLPYNTILIPAAAIFASASRMKGPDVAAVRNKVKRWFWCSVFGQAYENSPNSQAAKDYGELRQWISDGPLPHSVSQFSFDPSSLRLITPRQRAVYRGVIALVLRHGARDFHGGHRITANLAIEQKIDDHHIFPQGFFPDRQLDINPILRDCVLNRTLIDKQTNIRIGKLAPSVYLGEISRRGGQAHLAAILESHLLPSGPDSPLLKDQFEEFLEARQQWIAEQLVEVTK